MKRSITVLLITVWSAVFGTATSANAAFQTTGLIANDKNKTRGNASGNLKSRADSKKGNQSDIDLALPDQPRSLVDPAPGQPAKDNRLQAGSPPKAEEKNGQFVIAPIPLSSPAIGSGLEWVVGYVFRLNKDDKVTPPSFLGTGGLYTNNGSRGALLGGSLHFKRDKFRVTAAIGKGTINYDFFGVSKAAGDRGLFIPITVAGTGFLAQTLVRLTKGFYVGPRFQQRQLDARIDFGSLKLPDTPGTLERIPSDIVQAIPRDLLQTKTVALGPHLQRDTRDDFFYPTSGSVFNLGGDLFSKALGSKFTYQTYQIKFESYRSLSEKQVLAFGSLGCAADGSRVPFYDLCLFGASNYLRGYATGRYQDRRMFATQAEYRLRLPKLLGIAFTEKFGVVGFGGFGWVGKKLDDLALDQMLPSAGGGIRFRLTKAYPINLRLDYGVGKSGHTVTIGVGEAF